MCKSTKKVVPEAVKLVVPNMTEIDSIIGSAYSSFYAICSYCGGRGSETTYCARHDKATLSVWLRLIAPGNDELVVDSHSGGS